MLVPRAQELCEQGGEADKKFPIRNQWFLWTSSLTDSINPKVESPEKTLYLPEARTQRLANTTTTAVFMVALF